MMVTPPMTDAEKMREAAAQIVNDYEVECGKWFMRTGKHVNVYEALPTVAAAIRALPIPPVEASAPAADCQQAGLVTVDAAKYGRRNVQKMIRQWDAHRTACRAEGTQAIQDTLDAMEEHIDYAYRANTVPPDLLDEVKAALRAAEDALADSQWSGGSAERRAHAALARLGRGVGIIPT